MILSIFLSLDFWKLCVCECAANHLFNLGSSNQFKSTFDLTSRGPFLVILISISTGLYTLPLFPLYIAIEFANFSENIVPGF